MKAILIVSIVLLICGCGAKDPTSPTDIATRTTAKMATRHDVELSRSTGVVPHAFRLSQNYPNPFNLSTVIRFALPEASHVRLVVYNGSGRKVKTLVDSFLSAGYHRATWDATDNMGWPVASGVYLYRLETGSFVATRRMVLVQ